MLKFTLFTFFHTLVNWFGASYGQLYVTDPQYSQYNGLFNLNEREGKISFSSNLHEKMIVLEYVSDGMEGGNDSEIQVNKLFEDYMYSYIKYALISNRVGAQEYIVNRTRKEKSALLRNAKIRISNIHPGRLLMNLRGRNKWIK